MAPPAPTTAPDPGFHDATIKQCRGESISAGGGGGGLFILFTITNFHLSGLARRGRFSTPFPIDGQLKASIRPTPLAHI